MATALHSARTRFFDKCGKPLCGGTVHTYQVSTTTAKPTYTDVNKTAVNTNPVILDSIGSAAIFLDGAYRVRVLDRNGVLVEDIAYIESWISATEKDALDASIEDVSGSLSSHVAKNNNPHGVTKAQLGLGNVDNTSDINKPLSDAAINALSEKSDKSDTYTKNETDNRIVAVSSTTYAGHKGYVTLAAAQAAQASLPANTLVEVTNDTATANNGVYIWDGVTLVKSTHDPLTQAKAYTDNRFTIVKNLYDASKNANDVYLNTVSPYDVRASTGTVMGIFPVTAGKTYAVKSSAIANNAFMIALRDSNSTAVGATLGKVALNATSDSTVKTFTVPSNSTAKYALVNIKLSGFSLDITNDLVVNEGTSIGASAYVSKIAGYPIRDIELRDIVIDDSDIVTTAELYSVTNNVADKYINPTSQKIESSSGAMLTYFAVKAGHTYIIKSSDINKNGVYVALKDTSNTDINSAVAMATLQSTSDSTVKTFTVPSDSTAKYAFLNVKIPLYNLDLIASGLHINAGGFYTTSLFIVGINDKAIADADAQQRLAALETTTIPSKLYGKKWVAIGDSITEHNFRANQNYHDFVAHDVGGMTVYNYGISGSGFWNRSDVANTITQNPDYITVFWGANDLIRAPKILGNRDSVGTDSVGGLINKVFSELITKFYNKKLAVITLLPRDIYNNLTNAVAIDENGVSQGYTATQLADLIISIAEKYSIPVLDLYRESNLYPWITAANQLYFTAPTLTSPDGLHPNDAGQRVIADKIKPFLESI